MIRRGPWKLIWAATDPTMLFNIDEDPLELKNLVKDPAHADIVAAFENEVQERWNVAQITSEVLGSQVRRRLVGNALKLGRRVRFVYLPGDKLLTDACADCLGPPASFRQVRFLLSSPLTFRSRGSFLLQLKRIYPKQRCAREYGARRSLASSSRSSALDTEHGLIFHL